MLNPEYVIRITADCPLLDWNYLDLAIEQLEADTDYMSELTESFPDGLDIEIMKFSVLEEAWQNAKMASEREHVTLYIRNHPDKYKLQNFECPISGIGDKRWTLDEPADLELIEKIYEYFISQGKYDFDTENILQFLEANPELNKINSMIGRNEGLKKSLKDDYIVNGL